MEEYFTIQQMADLTNLSAHTLRYYERVGLMRDHIKRDDSSGYRYYTMDDAGWIGFIKKLRSTGMPIRDIKRYTELVRQGEDTITARLQLLEQHRQRIQEHQHEIEQHLHAINAKIDFYQGASFNGKGDVLVDACFPGLQPQQAKTQDKNTSASHTNSQEEQKNKYDTFKLVDTIR